jgi:ABC-type transport system involved in cytochrome bd biosynthesis fused ATPase/permease subunit
LRRIALARALLADFPVLLLDEPTEGLDPDVADQLVADLLEATRDRTVVLVTHRREHLADLDEIVELDAGRVVV